MAIYELRVGDTYPPIPVTLSDNSSTPAIDLTNIVPVTGVHFALKGPIGGLITGIFTVGQVPVTGTFSSNSASVTSVTPTTGYSNGATVYVPGVVPTGTTILSGAGTSTLTLSAQATSPASGQAFIVNLGLVYIPLNAGMLATGFTVADSYSGEGRIHWANGGLQTVPNAFSANFTVVVDTDEAQE